MDTPKPATNQSPPDCSASNAVVRERPATAFWPCSWLAVVLLGAKAVHWSLPDLEQRRLTDYATDFLVSSYRDLLFVVVVGVVSHAALALASSRPRLRRLLFGSLVAFGALCSAYAVASVQVFAFLRSPLTYPLLFLAGDMQHMRASLGSFLSPELATALAAVPAVYLLLVWVTARRPPPAPLRARRNTLILAALVAAHLVFGHLTFQGSWSDRDDHLIVRSPHWEIVRSVAAELLGGRAVAPFEPVLPADLADLHSARRPLSRWTRPRPPRNLIVLVLESTATRFLSLYGSKYKTTPQLEAEAGNALVFDNFYSHVGFTANAMAAITLSIFPYMTWREYTVEFPRFPGCTIGQKVKEHAYRTAFLHSGDLGYARQGQFLKDRGFDVLQDVRDLAPDHQLSTWGGEDAIVIDGFFRWLDQDRKKPFFAMIWTAQSHYPYEPSANAPLIDFFKGDVPPDDYDLGRYLNTLNQVDAQLGRMFGELRRRGLARDTLVVITGDHGEAFGSPHSNWGHGMRLYQEDVCVPLIIWNPRLFPRGGRLHTIGGHIDINPTIAELMGLKPHEGWHGHSLFDARRPPRTYFYAAGGDYLLGVREEDWKYIANVTEGSEELYHLTDDPDEQTNVAAEQPERCRRLRQRLVAWKESVGRHLAAVTQ